MVFAGSALTKPIGAPRAAAQIAASSKDK